MIERYLTRNYYAKIFEPPPPKPPPVSQAVFITNGQAASRYHTFIVPEGIYFISSVLVSLTSQTAPASQNPLAYIQAAIRRGGQTGTIIFSTSDALNVNGVGGGNGGARGADGDGNRDNTSGHANYLSGGGAGGYTGNGGNGGAGNFYGLSNPGGAGVGGGGGGGGGYMGNPPTISGSHGGPVGLMGQGTNGTPGGGVYSPDLPPPGGIGSAFAGPYVGAGYRTYWGGDLRWKNNIPVSPGEVLTIDLGYHYRDNAAYWGPGCRIMYGNTRSYPSDAQNAIPQGQAIITNQNTTWIVPAGITSICACAQQFHGGYGAIELIDTGGVKLRAVNGGRIGTGGGDGGAPGVATLGSMATSAEHGGGGCGGYDGNGGKGGDTVGSTPAEAWEGQPGSNGTNTGGQGGSGSSNVKNTGPVFGGQTSGFSYYPVTSGGVIGIKGRLPSGSYYDPVDGNAGGGSVGNPGGALAYINNLAVTPGASLTINALGGRVRIIYGPDRSYPLNAFDL